MKKLKQLSIDLKNAEKNVATIKKAIEAMDDGFQYVVLTHCYQTLSMDTYSNYHTTQEHIDHYYGDNGLVEVYTTNPDFKPEDNGGLRTFELLEVDDLEEYLLRN